MTTCLFRKVKKSGKSVEYRGKTKNGHKMSIYKPIFFIYGLNYLFRCTDLKKEGRSHRGFSSTHTFFRNPVWRDLSPHFSCVFFPIFDNDFSTSNKCHFQTVKARATGLRSYERSFNVVSGSHKIFYIISS